MTVTAADLRKRLESVPDDTTLYLLLDGKINAVESFVKADECRIAIIRGKGRARRSKQYTVTEDGLIGGLNAFGASDAMIAEILERSEASITRRRKQLETI